MSAPRALLSVSDKTDIAEFGISLDAPGEDSLGDHFYAGARADALVKAEAIADRLPHLLSKKGGHAQGGMAHRQPSRFQHDYFFGTKPFFPEQQQRDDGGLARTRRCGKYRGTMAERLFQLFGPVVDGEVRQRGGLFVRSIHRSLSPNIS